MRNQDKVAFGIGAGVGLTKLEYFSIHCLQGILAKRFDEAGENYKETVADAIEYAQELLNQLENET